MHVVVVIVSQASPLLVMSEHRRSFVFEVLVKELSIRSIMIRWSNPFPWYYAWEGYAYAGGAVEPGRCGAASKLLAEIRGEMVAVLSEEVVGGAHELLRGLHECQSGPVPLVYILGEARTQYLV